MSEYGPQIMSVSPQYNIPTNLNTLITILLFPHQFLVQKTVSIDSLTISGLDCINLNLTSLFTLNQITCNSPKTIGTNYVGEMVLSMSNPVIVSTLQIFIYFAMPSIVSRKYSSVPTVGQSNYDLVVSNLGIAGVNNVQ